MKVIIRENEWYPVLTIRNADEEETEYLENHKPHVIPKEIFERYQKAMKDFGEIQRLLEDVYYGHTAYANDQEYDHDSQE